MQRHHRHTITAAMLVLIGTLPLASPARAGQETRCVATGELIVSPGLSRSPTSGTITSQGPTGTTNCDGPINGYQPTGAGSRTEDARYGLDGPDICASGTEGDYTMSFTIPTTAGDQVVSDKGVFNAGGLEHGFITVAFQGERMHGTAQLVPLEGDCVTAPITRVFFRCEEFVVNDR